MSITDSTVEDNLAGSVGGGFGGGVWSYGSLEVTASSVSGNLSYGGTAQYGQRPGEPAYGGGMDLAGTATISGTTISGNTAQGGVAGAQVIPPELGPNDDYTEIIGFDGGTAIGGGIFSVANLELIDSTISGNATIGSKGGGYVPPPFSYRYGSRQPQFVTHYGPGGVASGGGLAIGSNSTNQASLANDTISDNSATGGLGGGRSAYLNTRYGTRSYAYPNFQFPSYGGGVANQNALTAANVTITSNSVGQAGTGGGLDASGSTATLNNTIVALNSNAAGQSDDISLANPSGTAGSVIGSYDLIGTGGSGGLTNGTDGNQVGIANPLIGPLADNGGPTETNALLTGSPAIDAGSNALAVDPSTGDPLATDQRGTGFDRIINGTVDIGAYEAQSYLTAESVDWGSQSVALHASTPGSILLPAGRQTDLPWLGIQKLQLTLSQGEFLSATDITVTSAIGVNYGPVTISGSGSSYVITLAQPVTNADRLTITIGSPFIAPFTGALDILPGDVNDDGIVNSQDLVDVRDEWLGIGGAKPTIFGDINGDGAVNATDYNDVRLEIGTSLPSMPSGEAAVAFGTVVQPNAPTGSGKTGVALSASAPEPLRIQIETSSAPAFNNRSLMRTRASPLQARAGIQLARKGRGLVAASAKIKGIGIGTESMNVGTAITRTSFILLALAIGIGTAPRCRADGLVVEAPSVSAMPGSSGTFEVLLQNTNASGGLSYSIAADSLEMSLTGSAGSAIQFTDASINTLSAPYLFTFSLSADFGIPFVGNTLPDTLLMTADAGDVVGSYPGFTTVGPGQTFGLAVVSYAVSSNAAAGTSDSVLFELAGGATSLSDNSFPANPLAFTIVNGTINVSSVPEPSSLVLMAIALSLGCLSLGRLPPAR